MVLPICSCCKSVIEVPFVHWITSTIFHVPLALGALGVLHPPDPSVLLVLVLRGISCGLVGRDVRELLVIVLRTQLVIIRVAKGGHVDLMIRRVVSHMAVLK
jgi:hypothetical protein